MGSSALIPINGVRKCEFVDGKTIEGGMNELEVSRACKEFHVRAVHSQNSALSLRADQVW